MLLVGRLVERCVVLLTVVGEEDLIPRPKAHPLPAEVLKVPFTLLDVLGDDEHVGRRVARLALHLPLAVLVTDLLEEVEPDGLPRVLVPLKLVQLVDVGIRQARDVDSNDGLAVFGHDGGVVRALDSVAAVAMEQSWREGVQALDDSRRVRSALDDTVEHSRLHLVRLVEKSGCVFARGHHVPRCLKLS